MLRHCLRRSIIPRTPFRPAILPPFRSTHYKASPSDEARSSSKSAQAARTDKTHAFKYPDGDVQASGHPISGTRRKPTLASFSLEGKTAVVTGGARGLGLVMAQGMLMSGADIALVDLNEDGAKEAADRLLKTYRSKNPDAEREPKITAHACDVASASSIDQCIASILQQHSQITTLLTSAGFTENFPAEYYPPDRFRKLMAVNVDGTYFFATAVARHIFERKGTGSMVFVGSMSAAIVNVPQPQAPYNASKAAVRQLAASLAVEWAERGIRVNCISPGYMLTALTEKILAERPDFREEWTSRIPMGKMGNPEDLMGAVTFLASDASSYVTGADLRIDGGYTLI